MICDNNRFLRRNPSAVILELPVPRVAPRLPCLKVDVNGKRSPSGIESRVQLPKVEKASDQLRHTTKPMIGYGCNAYRGLPFAMAEPQICY